MSAEARTTPRRLLSAEEVADMIGMTADYVYALSRRGADPHHHLRPHEAVPARGHRGMALRTRGWQRSTTATRARARKPRAPAAELSSPSMTAERGSRRSYGTGSLIEKGGSWYGKWRIGDRQVMRKLGAVAPSRLAQRINPQAGRVQSQNRNLYHDGGPPRRAVDARRGRRSLPRACGPRARAQAEHRCGLRVILRRHLGPFFGATALDRITPDEIAAYMAAKAGDGLATKTVDNHLNFAHGALLASRSSGAGPQATR